MVVSLRSNALTEGTLGGHAQLDQAFTPFAGPVSEVRA
jgi:hypothetical protein